MSIIGPCLPLGSRETVCLARDGSGAIEVPRSRMNVHDSSVIDAARAGTAMTVRSTLIAPLPPQADP